MSERRTEATRPGALAFAAMTLTDAQLRDHLPHPGACEVCDAWRTELGKRGLLGPAGDPLATPDPKREDVLELLRERIEDPEVAPQADGRGGMCYVARELLQDAVELLAADGNPLATPAPKP
jgi:hypothetical protein